MARKKDSLTALGGPRELQVNWQVDDVEVVDEITGKPKNLMNKTNTFPEPLVWLKECSAEDFLRYASERFPLGYEEGQKFMILAVERAGSSPRFNAAASFWLSHALFLKAVKFPPLWKHAHAAAEELIPYLPPDLP